jgi:Homeodomain-like domain
MVRCFNLVREWWGTRTGDNKLPVLSMSDRGRLGGRPTLYTPETIDKLLANLADGLTIKQACLACSISESTLSDWRERYADLEARLTEAREQARRKALANIKAAGDSGDWRASEAFLRMSFAADYRRDASINVSATASAQQAVVVTAEDRNRIQERIKRLQESEILNKGEAGQVANGNMESNR